MPAVPPARRALMEPLEKRTLFATVAPAGLAEATVATGLSSPTAMQFAPDGRLFVAQQGGALRVIKNGALLATPFVSLTVNSSGERGLLGVAFDPNFASNGYVYVYHTVPSPLHNRVTRFTANPNNPDVALPNSGVPILDLDGLSATNHNGGAIHFGPDGKLYVAVGENAVPQNSQTLANRHGKMLRINPDGTIPTDNPFYNRATGANRSIWALGLRNPYTFAIQPGTGTMYINDVGQSAWEEINLGVAGANYGWDSLSSGRGIEGPRSGQPLPSIGTYRDPLFAYRAPSTGSDPLQTGRAITGGTFYNPPVSQFAPDYAGDYFYADFGNGWIRKYDPATGTTSLMASNANTIVDLKTGPDGSLYFLERGNGAVKRIRANVPSPSAPDLAAAADTGASNTDNITSNNRLVFTGTAPAGSSVLVVMDGTTVVGSAATSAGGAYSVTTSAIPDGAHRFTAVTRNAAQLASDPSGGVTVTVDTARPVVSAAAFDYRTGTHKVRFTFNENVAASLAAGDLQVDNPLSDQPAVPASNVTYDPATNTATFTFGSLAGGVFANGNYRATLSSAGVFDPAGNTLVTNGPANYQFEFFVLHGDINRDRRVDSTDFATLAGNFGRAAMTYEQGDLTGDGRVDSSDFALLAGNFGKTVPAPPAAVVSASASVEESGRSTRRAARAAGVRPRAWRRLLRLSRGTANG